VKEVYVNIILPHLSNRELTYIVPTDLHGAAKVGVRALVPLGKRLTTGFIVGINSRTDIKDLKEVRDVLDREPIFPDDLWKSTRWMAGYYFASWGDVLKASTPQGIHPETKRRISLKEGVNIEELLSKSSTSAPKRTAVIKALQQYGKISVSQLVKKTGVKSIYSSLSDLERLGYIETEETLARSRVKPRLENFVEFTGPFQDKEVLKKKISETEKNAPKQVAILITLLSRSTGTNEPMSLVKLMRHSKASLSSVRALRDKGIVNIFPLEVTRDYKSGFSETLADIVLNRHQQTALDEILKGTKSNRFQSYLLHGVTGSGKTQVYIEAIREVLKAGKTALVLVPEISLTPQLVHRFRLNLEEEMAVMHSRMSVGERYDAWRRVADGKCRIVIGVRSAIFAPLKNLGLIVVDEEHEATYKQYDASPRYNARDVALVRARFANAVVVLGSATPSVESYFNALSGKYKLLQLPERADNAKLPKIEIVDLAQERKAGKLKGSISVQLKERIESRLTKGEGVILLQNRRGFSTYAECLDCGYVETCENCNVTLTYHVTKKHLRCHYCGFVKQPPTACPECLGVSLYYGGVGTQKVEDEVATLLPGVKLVRMDLDTTTRKGSHDKILSQFADGGTDILLGTQMVAKGLDFSRVTLVGVISADTGMLLPDFRASERTFQLLTQVSGRAGRSELEGEVIIQTYLPEHFSLKYVLANDYVGFYNHELISREELDYPPFSRLALIEFKGENEKAVEQCAVKFADLLKEASGPRSKSAVSSRLTCKVLGPAPAAISKLKRNYRWHIVIKSIRSKDPSGKSLRELLLNTEGIYRRKFADSNVKMTIDIDPQGMM
jgi:primosomal protein N' (replication factor Y)